MMHGGGHGGFGHGQLMSDSDAAVIAAYDGAILRRFLRHVWPYRRAIFGSLFAVLGFSLSGLAIPLMVGLTIDRAMGGDGNTGLLGVMVGVMAVIAIVNWIANYLQQIVIARVSSAFSSTCGGTCSSTSSGSAYRSRTALRSAG